MSEYQKRKQQLQMLMAQTHLLQTSRGCCCLSISPTEFSLAYARNTLDKLVIEFYGSYPYSSQEGLKNRLSEIVKQYQLKNVSCAWVLAPQDYQLLQTDALPVTENEFQAAIRWKLKDLLRYPIDDVVIDKFEIPKSSTSLSDKIMVVAAQKSYLQKMSDEINASGLNLSHIDITELTLRNMMVLLEQNGTAQALVYVQSSVIQIIITCDQQLYFSRNIDFGWAGLIQKKPEELPAYIEEVASEITRSFNYYASQWRRVPPTHVTFAATKQISEDAIKQLSQFLSLPVQWLNLGERFETKQEMNVEQQGKYLPIIGELFRKECERYASTNKPL